MRRAMHSLSIGAFRIVLCAGQSRRNIDGHNVASPRRVSMMAGPVLMTGRAAVRRTMSGAVEDAAAGAADGDEQRQRDKGARPEGLPPPLSCYCLALASQRSQHALAPTGKLYHTTTRS